VIPIEVQNTIRSQPARVLELRLLRGSTPWSLAGTDGTKRAENIRIRDLLVSWINTAIAPLGWSAQLGAVRSAAAIAQAVVLSLPPSDPTERTPATANLA
jgi:hypothetical protein